MLTSVEIAVFFPLSSSPMINLFDPFSGSSDGTAELITVTLMIAAEGEFELPAVRNLSDLKLVLSKIGGTPASNLLATELMWTPQAEGDVMSQEDCLSMYPNLVPL